MDLLPLLLIFAVMLVPLMFMSSRQRKAQREQQAKVAQLGVGDEVRTHSGFYGLIVEEFDDVVILESENGAQTKWARQAIAGAVAPTEDSAAAAEDDDAVVEGTATDADTASDAPVEDGTVPGVTARDTDTTTDGRRDA
ncbi:preprotein translocase subunit YajC [Brachybacterium horti]